MSYVREQAILSFTHIEQNKKEKKRKEKTVVCKEQIIESAHMRFVDRKKEKEKKRRKKTRRKEKQRPNFIHSFIEEKKPETHKRRKKSLVFFCGIFRVIFFFFCTFFLTCLFRVLLLFTVIIDGILFLSLAHLLVDNFIWQWTKKCIYRYNFFFLIDYTYKYLLSNFLYKNILTSWLKKKRRRIFEVFIITSGHWPLSMHAFTLTWIVWNFSIAYSLSLLYIFFFTLFRST